MAATGKTIQQVASDRGYSKHTFYRVIKNERSSAEVRQIISDIIEKPISEIWPEPTGEQE